MQLVNSGEASQVGALNELQHVISLTMREIICEKVDAIGGADLAEWMYGKMAYAGLGKELFTLCSRAIAETQHRDLEQSRSK